MAATTVLRSEHEAILRMVEAVEVLARRIQYGRMVAPAAMAAATEWFSTVAHRIHRDKEEEVLFPALSAKGLHPGAGCIGALLASHEEGREAFKRMLVGMAEGDPGAWAQAVWSYAEMMRRHIRREDEVIFGLADSLFGEQEQTALAQGFAAIDEKARLSQLDERMREAECVVQQTVRSGMAA